MVHETINAPVSHPSSDIDQVLSINRVNTRTLKTSYIFTKAKTNLSLHQLINGGANGGLAGSDIRVLHHTGHKINIVGIDNHELTGFDEVTATSSQDTNAGIVIGIFNEHAFLGKETPSIHLTKWNISRLGWMTNPSKLEASKDWRHWKDMPCPSSSRMAWHTPRSLVGLMTKSLKHAHMSSSPHLTLGNLLSWIMSSAQKMNSPGHNFRIPSLSMISFLMLKVTSTKGS